MDAGCLCTKGNTMYDPKFSTTERKGKFAIWVTMPNGEKYNIWDLDPRVFGKFSPDVCAAIQIAFTRGFEACNMLHRQVSIGVSLTSDFVKKD